MARIHPVSWFRGLVWTSSPAKLNAFGGNKKGKKDKTWFHIIPENFTTGLLGSIFVGRVFVGIDYAYPFSGQHIN